MRVYGHASLQVLYACDCVQGEVVLSSEHSGERWIDPAVYRERYFGDDVVKTFAGPNPCAGEMVANIAAAIDAYLSWRALQPGLSG
jgi:hypothetical protein